MSSIDKKQEQALIRFYQERILPLAPEAGTVEAAPFPSEGTDTYYVTRQGGGPSREDFELPLRDREQIAATLDRLWADTPLAGLGGDIARLSNKFRDVRQRAEVSSFIYEMF